MFKFSGASIDTITVTYHRDTLLSLGGKCSHFGLRLRMLDGAEPTIKPHGQDCSHARMAGTNMSINNASDVFD